MERYLEGEDIETSTLINDLKEIPRRFPDIDLALLHLGGTTLLGVLMVTMDPKQGVEVIKLIKPKAAIPIHYEYAGPALEARGLFGTFYLHVGGDPIVNPEPWRALAGFGTRSCSTSEGLARRRTGSAGADFIETVTEEPGCDAGDGLIAVISHCLQRGHHRLGQGHSHSTVH